MIGVGNPPDWRAKCGWCGEPVDFDECVTLAVMVAAPRKILGVEKRYLEGSYHEGVCARERLEIACALNRSRKEKR
jgi:hypothetical protein